MFYELFVSCGDPSADLHSANLVRAIKKLSHDIKITSIGGEELEKVSDNFLFNMTDLNLHGFLEPIKHYFKLKDLLYNKIYNYLKTSLPNAVIPVDFYGFNINLCRLSRELGLKVFYYISPQIWATRPNRINQLKKYVNHMFVIFPFEEKIYRDANIPVTFVGHPLLDLIPEQQAISTGQHVPTIGLFPGSRKPVVKWNLPVMIQTANIIKEIYPEVKFQIAGLESLKDCYKNSLRISTKRFILECEVNFNCDYNSRKFDIAISTSGTVTLENALLGIPMVVIYKLPWMMYFFIKSIIRISTITIVNLIANEQIVPEFIQEKAKPRNIAEPIVRWFQNRNILVEIKEKYKQVRNMLGTQGSYDRTANLILKNIM
ncbi:MAG: lipid-A-disaccharide synthase [Elusimicrobiota bacterium]|nr:lipid-A-disaccharide synthase [Elusimicrobiota bacterium]